ncbi:MAG: GNAT family N-acetyltransferase [bacterium]
MGGNKILRIETERLIIRKFVTDDWKYLQEIAISKEQSEFADCDHPWPTDDRGIKEVVEYFSNEHQFWAVEVKELEKVVCFININYMDDEQTLDIGHVMNSKYLGNDFEYEALKALYNYGFIQLGAERIQAKWACNNKNKLAPLLKLGMNITEKRMTDKFRPDPDGNESQFEACTLIISKEEWLKNPAK